MNISSINKYKIFDGKWFKQIYSPHHRMLQITKDKVFYIDTENMKTLREFKKNIERGEMMYLDFEGLKTQLGYKTHKPRIGSFGRAIIKASKEGNHRSIGWVRKQLDELFKKDTHKKERSFDGRNKK